MDFASSTRAAEVRVRWKGIAVKYSVVPSDLARLWDILDQTRAIFCPSAENLLLFC